MAKTEPKTSVALDAVFYADLDQLLPDFDSKLRNGELKCGICGCDLNECGIHSVEMVQGQLKWCCLRPSCVLTLGQTEG
jgi:hypothetical protein